jgi:phospholipid N-methyltransferase
MTTTVSDKPKRLRRVANLLRWRAPANPRAGNGRKKVAAKPERRRSSGPRQVFFQGFLRHPGQVASIVPSSRFLERRVVTRCQADSATLLIELGPGVGSTTRALLAALPADGLLLCIEINPDFIPVLRAIEDPRLIVHCGSAERLAETLTDYGLGLADAVVSGIPFSAMPRDLSRRIVNSIHSALAPGGRFVAYQMRDRIQTVARPLFGRPQVDVELRNIPPLRVYTWHKA